MGFEDTVNEKTLSQIEFRVEPSQETNDHEVRIIIDGQDLIREHCSNMMGLDPDDILHDRFLAPRDSPFEATVARCSCGVVGCGSATVEVSSDVETVTWNCWDGGLAAFNPGRIVFQKSHYLDALSKALTDHSWETPDRTAARLLANKVDREFLLAHELTYQWASGRIKEGAFTVSLIGPASYHQVLLHVGWSTETPEAIAEKTAKQLRQDPGTWLDVAWYGPGTKPPFEGPGWRYQI